MAVNPVTIGANCQLVAASLQLKGGNMELPIQARVPLRPVVADWGVTGRRWVGTPVSPGPRAPEGPGGSGGGRRPVAADHGIDAQVVERSGGDRGRDRGALAAGHRDVAEVPALPGGGSADGQPNEQNNRLPRHATSDRWQKATHRLLSRIIVPNPPRPTTLDTSPRRADRAP